MQKKSLFLLIVVVFYFKTTHSQNLNLEITGNDSIETKVLHSYSYNKTLADYNAITREIDSLRKTLFKAGYIENRLLSLKRANDSLFTSTIALNTKYETIILHYNNNEIDKSITDLVSNDNSDTHFTIPFTSTESVLNFINSEIAKKGFPFTKLKLSEIKIKDSKTLEANIVIIKDKQQRGLDKIIIKGYEKFPKSYLKRFLKIKPETVFNIEDIKKRIQTLDNLRFANTIKEPEVLFTNDSTHLYLYIEKTLSNTFDGFLGFSTNEETNNIEFNGYLNLELNNNFNYGESFRLLYKSDESEQKNFEVRLNLPYLFSTPIGTELELNIFKKDSSFTTVNQKAKLYYQLDAKSKVFLGIDTTESNNLLDSENSFNVDDYKSRFYILKYDFENRRNYNRLFQINSLVNIEVGFGSRDLNNTTEQQTKVALNAHHIFNLNESNSIFLRLNGALLTSNSFLENELIRFGGINSIRGFQENSLAATLFGVLNTEYRYKLSNSIYVHSIIDYSRLENKITVQNENLYGFGLGFGIITKAGLLKFNFANGKTQDQKFKFSNSKIHLSLVAIF